jgi:phosphoglycerate dehydrogenase-like enzyme
MAEYPFRFALTGDMLDMDGRFDGSLIGLDQLDHVPHMRYRFLRDLAPNRDDPTYWQRFYSLVITPEHIADVHGLYVVRPWVKASTFARGAENLTVIGRAGAGYDKIDIDACTENDVAVFNAPDALTHATASSALLLMLALAKRLTAQERIARAGRWDLQSEVTGGEIQHKTLGIIGLGRSGRELARLVAPFDMRITAYSPHADPAEAAALGIELMSMDEVFAQADYISVHASLRPDTRGMIRREHLIRMKPHAYFVNVARGELVEQDALVDILREGRIAGAGLDVFEEEPLPIDHPLVALENVILTPHWLPATVDAGRPIGLSTLKGLMQAARGEVPHHVINTDVLDRPGFRQKLARFKANRSENDNGADNGG